MQAPRDQNFVPAALGQSSTDSTNTLPFLINSLTGRLLVDSGGSAGSTLTVETPTGTVDDSNVTFTVAHTPLFIVVNGGIYVAGTGIYTSYVAGTITLASPVGTGGFIRSFYNA